MIEEMVHGAHRGPTHTTSFGGILSLMAFRFLVSGLFELHQHGQFRHGKRAGNLTVAEGGLVQLLFPAVHDDPPKTNRLKSFRKSTVLCIFPRPLDNY